MASVRCCLPSAWTKAQLSGPSDTGCRARRQRAIEREHTFAARPVARIPNVMEMCPSTPNKRPVGIPKLEPKGNFIPIYMLIQTHSNARETVRVPSKLGGKR